MKQVTTIIIFLFLNQQSSAQRVFGDFHSVNLNVLSHTDRDFIDTLQPISFIPVNEGGLGCFTGTYNASDSGYVAGNNKYGDKEKAQFFSLSKMGFQQPATIQEVTVYFGIKAMNAFPEDIFIRIYDKDSTSFLPGNLIGTSDLLNMSVVNTAGLPSDFTFSAPVTVPDSFFVSVVLPVASGDTVAIVSTLDDCRAFPDWSWELWADGTWHTLLNSWILDVDLAVFPVMDFPFNIGIDEPKLNPVVNIYPNPATGISHFNINLITASEVEIMVINSTGVVVRTIDAGKLNIGLHEFTLPVSDLPDGVYELVIRSDHFIGNKSFEICR